MKQSGSINTKDLDSSDDVYISIRYDKDNVALGISLKKGSDIETVITKEEAKKLQAILKDAIEDNS